MRRRNRFPDALAAAVAALLGTPLPARGDGSLVAPAGAQGLPSPHVFARAYTAMGTDVTLSAFTSDDTGAAAAFTEAVAEIRRLEALMTDWPHEGQPPSDVLRINAAAGHEAVVVAEETFEVIAFSLDISRRSGGAFDVTYAAMRGLWKFDEDMEKKLPPPAEIARRRRLISWRDVVLDRAAKTVKLRRVGDAAGPGGHRQGVRRRSRGAVVARARDSPTSWCRRGAICTSRGRRASASWMVGVRDPRGGPAR